MTTHEIDGTFELSYPRSPKFGRKTTRFGCNACPLENCTTFFGSNATSYGTSSARETSRFHILRNTSILKNVIQRCSGYKLLSSERVGHFPSSALALDCVRSLAYRKGRSQRPHVYLCSHFRFERYDYVAS